MPESHHDNRIRCRWVPPGDALYAAYHDSEWGVPVRDDRTLFEFLVLESAQAGLSWRLILSRRENYHRAFAGFDPVRVAKFTPKKIESLLLDPGIIRNRAKVEATVNNARCFLAVSKEFGGFSEYIWRFVEGAPRQNRWKTLAEIPVSTPESTALSLDLKNRGFRFLGPVVCYSHMQATGMVNDHTVDCFRHDPVRKLATPGRAKRNE
ncbi:MAG: DNA-3-methyladenine glycosylase I [Deltaproteobacteria bacterium]|nr:DNA-3-methyladenine glycosylase I [Deltaproteobacteria bacterium]